MFTDRSFDNYNNAVRDMRRNGADDSVLRLCKAMHKGIGYTPKVVREHFEDMGNPTWHGVALIAWDAVTYTLKVQAKFVAVGAAIGAAATWEFPMAGAAIGGRVALFLAKCYLAAIGLGSVTAIVGAVAGYASVPFESGCRKAIDGDIEGGARDIAEGLAIILEMVAAIIMLLCFLYGGSKVMAKINPKGLSNKLITRLQGLPGSVKNLEVLTKSRLWGYAVKEIHAMKRLSQNGNFYVIRVCNPARTKIGKGKPLEGKMLEIKGKSIRSGIHRGKVGVGADDLANLKKNYHLKPLPRNEGYELILKEGKEGALHMYKLQNASHTVYGDDAGKMVLLDPRFRPVIPDMDRLVCMRIDPASLKSRAVHLKDHAAYGDDPAEITLFNQRFNQLMGRKRVNTDPARHGYTSSNIKPNGDPIWHPDENELLLIFADSKVFEMSWNEFVMFCRVNKSTGLPQCFHQIKDFLGPGW